jgi:hypothetical protein
MRAMQVISFKNTGLFKRGIWLSGAALLAFVVSPAALDGSLWRNPASSLFAAAVLGMFFAYFLWKTRVYRLVDEVTDCEDHLKVQRGRSEEIVPLSNVSSAEVESGGGLHRITVRLREPTKLGAQFEFLPQASLWSNPAAVRRVAGSLSERANQMSGRGGFRR